MCIQVENAFRDINTALKLFQLILNVFLGEKWINNTVKLTKMESQEIRNKFPFRQVYVLAAIKTCN